MIALGRCLPLVRCSAGTLHPRDSSQVKTKVGRWPGSGTPDPGVRCRTPATVTAPQLLHVYMTDVAWPYQLRLPGMRV
jgi:hypothetical protein